MLYNYNLKRKYRDEILDFKGDLLCGNCITLKCFLFDYVLWVFYLRFEGKVLI